MLRQYSLAEKVRKSFEMGRAREFFFLWMAGKSYHRSYFYEPLLGMTKSEVEKIKTSGPVEAESMRLGDISQHLVTLDLVSAMTDAKVILELGTRTGRSTIALLSAAKKTKGHVFSMDVNECPEAASRVKSLGYEAYWTFIRGDDLTAEWSTPIDHLFIDSSHEYEQTLRELTKFEPFVKKGGVITMHDVVSFESVRRALTTYTEGRGDLDTYRYVTNNGLAVILKS